MNIEDQIKEEIADIQADLVAGKISVVQATEVLRAARDVYIAMDAAKKEKIVKMISQAITLLSKAV
jgi:hypothetical protein